VKGLLVAAALAVLTVVVVVMVLSVLGYDWLVGRRDQADSAWNQVDMQLRRRSDPEPGRGGQRPCRSRAGTFEALTEVRARAISAHGPVDQASAESALTIVLKSLFAVVESYPDLRTSQNFLEQQELSATEDRAAYATQYYNDAS
jgi:LemA protein